MNQQSMKSALTTRSQGNGILEKKFFVYVCYHPGFSVMNSWKNLRVITISPPNALCDGNHRSLVDNLSTASAMQSFDGVCAFSLKQLDIRFKPHDALSTSLCGRLSYWVLSFVLMPCSHNKLYVINQSCIEFYTWNAPRVSTEWCM